MKTKILLFVAFLAMSFAVNAQIDRTKQPKPGPAPKVKLGKVDKFKLPNGLQVIMVENHKLPRASANLTIDNKPVLEGNKAGVSDLMGALLGNGTTSTSKDNFNEKIDFYGASVRFGSSSAYASSLKKYFPEILGLLADGVKNPVFTQEEFDKEIKRTLDGLKSNEKNVGAIARRVQNALVYGKNHPYGEFISKESINAINLEDVKNFYNTYYKPNNAYLVIVGDINPTETKKLVTSLFKDWKKGNVPEAVFTKPTNPTNTEINFVDVPNAVQSEIAVINNINLKIGDKDFYAALLANQILGGDGTARLFMNLREDKGYTYGSYSRVRPSRYAGTFRASAQVRNVVTDSSVVELQKEIKRIRNEQVKAEELKNVKAKYTGNFVMDVQKPVTAARYALNIARHNLPANFYENYLANINAVTLQDVKNAANKYFKPENARIIIAGKGADVLENLEKGNYPIKYFDTKANATKKPEAKKAIPANITKEAVIKNYFNAIGGADKVKALKSTLVTYEGEAMGNKLESTEKRTATQYASTTAMGGNVMMKVTMNKDGVKMNGQALPPAMANDMIFSLGTFPEIGMLATKDAQLTGVEKVDGKDAYVITKKGKMVTTSSFYDVKTGLKVKETQAISMGGRTQNQEATFGEYKEINGFKFPSTKTGSMGPQKITFTLKEAKINEGVSDADFK